jgi:phage host-nuclease inhibitor protein Gam
MSVCPTCGCTRDMTTEEVSDCATLRAEVARLTAEMEELQREVVALNTFLNDTSEVAHHEKAQNKDELYSEIKRIHESYERYFAAAKEAGALSMLTFIAEQQGRNLATHPTWTAERMAEWRKREAGK